MKKTVVLGASPNPGRYSYLAVRKLKIYGHEVVAIGKKEGAIDDTTIIKDHPIIDNIDTVTLYLNPDNQKQYYDYIIDLKPKRIIFNPGTENDELADLAEKNKIETIEACTLVLLSTGQY
ncbi:MAG: CoA-binding protein [Chitinophagales bacterium]